MNKNISKWILLLLVCSLSVMMLAACGDKDNAKEGKKRNPNTTEGATPTPGEGDPTGTVTPTDTPAPTSTPEATPTPTPTPSTGSEAMEDLKGIIGTWIEEDGRYVVVQADKDKEDIQVIYGNWYSDNLTPASAAEVGGTTPCVMTLEDYTIKASGEIVLETSFEGNMVKYWFTNAGNGWYTIVISDVGSKQYRKTAVEYPFVKNTMTPRDFFVKYHGFWTLRKEYDFMYVLAIDNEYYLNFSTFYSEWGLNEKIEAVVKSYDEKDYYILLSYVDDYGQKGSEWIVIRDEDPDSREILIKNCSGFDEFDTYMKGIIYADLQSMEIPDLFYVCGLSNEDALVVLKDWHALGIANAWQDYAASDSSEIIQHYFEPYSNKHVYLWATDNYVVVKVEIK